MRSWLAVGAVCVALAGCSGGSSSPAPSPSTADPDVALIVDRFVDCIRGAGGQPSTGRVDGEEDGHTVVVFTPGSLRFLVTHSGDRTYTVPADMATTRKISAAGDTC